MIESPLTQNQEKLSLTTDEPPEYHTSQKTVLDNWSTPRVALKGLEELDNNSTRKEPYSGNGRMTQEHNTSSLYLTTIMFHQQKYILLIPHHWDKYQSNQHRRESKGAY